MNNKYLTMSVCLVLLVSITGQMTAFSIGSLCNTVQQKYVTSAAYVGQQYNNMRNMASGCGNNLKKNFLNIKKSYPLTTYNVLVLATLTALYQSRCKPRDIKFSIYLPMANLGLANLALYHDRYFFENIDLSNIDLSNILEKDGNSVTTTNPLEQKTSSENNAEQPTTQVNNDKKKETSESNQPTVYSSLVNAIKKIKAFLREKKFEENFLV